MDFANRLKEKILLYDGSKGFLLMQNGLAPGECPDAWNLDNPDVVYGVHKAYVDAGADVIQTNTLQASRYHLEARGLYDKLTLINRAGVKLATKAAGTNVLVAASVGPLGRVMAPFGDMAFDDAYEAFFEQIAAQLDAGADIIHFETFTDLSELRIAVIAARALSAKIPITATVCTEGGGYTLMGDSPAFTCAVLAALGVDCAGVNCGLAPREMLNAFSPFAAFGGPLCSKPNAGKPVLDALSGKVAYDATEGEFYETSFGFARLGARLIGGCCGSNPSHVRALRKAVDMMNADPAYGYANTAASAAASANAAAGDSGADGATVSAGDSGADGATVSAGGLDGAAAPSRGSIGLFSPGGSAALSGEALEACAIYAKRASERGEPLFTECGGGSIFIADVSRLCGGVNERDAGLNDTVVETLSDAMESDASATMFCLFAGNAADARSARAVMDKIAENARVYHKKPVIFFTDDIGVLSSAVKRYCGVPAIAVKKELADKAAAAAGIRNNHIIGI